MSWEKARRDDLNEMSWVAEKLKKKKLNLRGLTRVFPGVRTSSSQVEGTLSRVGGELSRVMVADN